MAEPLRGSVSRFNRLAHYLRELPYRPDSISRQELLWRELYKKEEAVKPYGTCTIIPAKDWGQVDNSFLWADYDAADQVIGPVSQPNRVPGDPPIVHPEMIENRGQKRMSKMHEKAPKPVKLTVIRGGASEQHGMSVREVEAVVQRNTRNVETRQAVRRAIRAFSEQAESVTSRKLQWLDAAEARELYVSILEHLVDGPPRTAVNSPDAVEQLQQITHDLMKYVQTRKVKTWAEVIPAGVVGNMAAFLHEYFGTEYKQKMNGVTRVRTRKQFFETFVGGYTSAKKVAQQIATENTRAAA